MIESIILFILGTVILIGGADILIKGSSKIARYLGISPLVVGLTIVALGTSFPELAVSIIAALQGNQDIAIGNIVGSNIANIGLIIGIAAIFFPLKVGKSTVFLESPFMIFASFLLFFFSYSKFSSGLSRVEGLIFLGFFFIFLGYVYYMARLQRTDTKLYKEYEKEYKDHNRMWKPSLMVIFGLVGVMGGAKFMVDSAVEIAAAIGVSNTIISVSVIALGTSLPELVTSVVAIYKKEPDIAIGNIIGSNIFNIFLILGLASTIAPLRAPPSMFLGMIMMLFFAIIFLLFALTKNEISRQEGIAFLLSYILYIVYIFVV